MNLIPVLYEDQYFIIVNKPAGLVVHATLDKKRDNLYDLLKLQLNTENLYLHHRLDKDTSGAILLTKDPKVNSFISEIFDNRQVVKTYLALTYGHWDAESGILEDFIKKEKGARGIELMKKVSKGGQKAITYYQVLENLEHDLSLVRFTLETGRMHQIRVQSAIRLHPLMGDPFYGNSDNDRKFKVGRLFLHSSSLEFTFQGILIKAEAPLPIEFSRYGVASKYF